MQKDYYVQNMGQDGHKIVQEAFKGVQGTVNTTVDVAEKLASKIENAQDEVFKAKEEGMKARTETFSDAKGKQLNEQYGKYIEGSIAESFAIKTQLFEERQQLMSDVSKLRLKIQEEKMDAELEIRKKKQDADFELEKTKKEIANLKKPSKIQKFWNWFCPFFGIGLGALTFFLLYILV
jgi:hypothetical protein